MRKLLFLSILAAFVLTTGKAEAQINHLDTTAGINLASDPVTTLSNVSGSGTLTGISCKVTAAVSGGPAWAIFVTIDGGSAQILQGGAYVYSNSWGPTNFIGVGSGASVGDFFLIPLNQPFSSSLVVTTFPLHAGTGGTLTCNVHRT